jgi:DNA polymerase V
MRPVQARLGAARYSPQRSVGSRRQLTAHLEALGIKTALDLVKADAHTLRMKFSVLLEKNARELASTACLELEEPAPPKQEICCSRIFGKQLTEIQPIKEAVATCVQRAAEKLCAQHSWCKKVRVSVRKGMFNLEEAKHANGIMVELPYPTNDVRMLTKAVIQAVDHIYRPGFKYSRPRCC